MPGEELLTADLGRMGVDSRARGGGRGGVVGGGCGGSRSFPPQFFSNINTMEENKQLLK